NKLSFNRTSSLELKVIKFNVFPSQAYPHVTMCFLNFKHPSEKTAISIDWSVMPTKEYLGLETVLHIPVA
ncbi:hypothetical protein ACQP3C_31310, partial [Escherichia coli]